jgi:hypothetical protein
MASIPRDKLHAFSDALAEHRMRTVIAPFQSWIWEHGLPEMCRGFDFAFVKRRFVVIPVPGRVPITGHGSPFSVSAVPDALSGI